MQGAPEKLGPFRLLSAWLLLGTATCLLAVPLDVAPVASPAVTAAAGIVGSIWAQRRSPSRLEALLAFCCVPYFVALASWTGQCSAGQPRDSFELVTSGWGTALAVASATAALTLLGKGLGSLRGPPHA